MSNPAETPSELARAKAWLDAAKPRWRLQTMQHRSRYNPKTGEYRQLPTRIRRFLNGTPVGMKSLVLALLKESAPYSSPVFDCETDGLEYRPTNTFIRKDGIEHATNGKDPTYTIIQDLLLDDGREDAFGFADESSCSQLGETEYHWDEPYVADCPDGGQGVSYQVTDISRDRETDLFSYRVRKVQALTVHVAPHVEECSRRRRVTVESWDNVYGEPGAFRWDDAKGGGAALDVPAPCGQADGTSVKVDVYRNPDCTYRVTVQTAESILDDGQQFSVYRDQYKANDTVRKLNMHAPLDRQGVEFSGGVTTRYTSERNEDGTWNNTTETETEREVLESTVETRVTPRGTHTLRVDTNVRSAASGISSQFGSWKSTKTPGGLFTNEYSEYARTLRDNLGLVCTDTLFVKTHESQSSVASVPANRHVDPAANGLVTTWNYDTDADGFVTRRVRTEQEHTVLYAAKRSALGALGRTVSFTHRSVTKDAADAFAANAVGESVEVRRTNGDLYDVEVQTFAKAPAGQRLGVECSKTVFQHVHENATSAVAVGSEASDAGDGKTHQLTYSVDASTGAVTKRERTTTELHVSESRRSVRVTARGTVVRTTDSNAASTPADPSSAGRELEWEMTPGGRYNVTQTTATPRTGTTGHSCEQDAFMHTDATTAMSANAPSGHVGGGSGGVYRERGSRLGDDGLWETTTSEHREQPVTGEVRVSVSARAKTKTTIIRQTSSQGAEPAASISDAGKSLVRTATRGGLWNIEETTVQPIAGTSHMECSRDAFMHVDTAGGTRQSAEEPHVHAPGGGHYFAKRQQLGDDGLWSVTDTDSAEQSVPSQTVETRVTRHGTVTRTTDMQVGSPGTGSGQVGSEHRAEKTRGGLFNVTTTSVSPGNIGETGASCEKTAFLHADSTTTVAANKDPAHAENAANGKYGGVVQTLTDLGTWEIRSTDNQEEQPTVKERQYKDAFGETTVTEEFSHQSDDGGRGGKKFNEEKLVQYVESQMTNGKRYNVRTTEETPTEVDSGWLNFHKETDKGLAVYYDFIVFRNARMSQVQKWIEHIKNIKYTGGNGSYANHPSISISPNKFKLWDGTVALTTTFTPKAWASGGSTKDDNWEKDDIKIKSVNFIPLSPTRILKVVTEETHKRGGGVGKDKFESIISGGIIKGSQFSYHPGNQAFSYDLITAVYTKGVVIDAPKTADTLWTGETL